jgi:hypothetical protein
VNCCRACSIASYQVLQHHSLFTILSSPAIALWVAASEDQTEAGKKVKNKKGRGKKTGNPKSEEKIGPLFSEDHHCFFFKHNCRSEEEERKEQGKSQSS